MQDQIIESNKKLAEESPEISSMDAVKKSLEIASKFTNNATISEFTEKIC